MAMIKGQVHLERSVVPRRIFFGGEMPYRQETPASKIWVNSKDQSKAISMSLADVLAGKQPQVDTCDPDSDDQK